MYIPEFWCGVIVTLLAEVTALIVLAVVLQKRKKQNAKRCGQCDCTDGKLYATDPPKVRCKKTGAFHNADDFCDCEGK